MKNYQRVLVFTKVPLDGHYKYKDIFQIFPADLTVVPNSSFKRHYPNILEYWYSEEDVVKREIQFESLQELETHTAATTTKRNKILSLLTCFTNHSFFDGDMGEGFWGIPMLYEEITDEVRDEVNLWSSKWCMNGYIFPGLPDFLKISEFSSPTVEQVKKINQRVYYLFEPNLDHDIDNSINFPSTIDALFDAYFALDPEKRQIVDAAVGYNLVATELNRTRRTMSLLASFTAMETMVNLEFRDVKPEKCETCGQLKFSVAKKFREFLLKYIGESEENKKKFNAYYSLRSKIVHTGTRLKSELLFSEYPRSELNDELVTRLEILQIGKLSVLHWLLMNK